MAAANGTSALQALAAGIMGEKVRRNAVLTPTPSEKAVSRRRAEHKALPVTAAGVPMDVPGAILVPESLADIAKDARRHAATLIEIADGIDRLLGAADPAIEASQAVAKGEAPTSLTIEQHARGPLQALGDAIIEEDKAAAAVLVRAIEEAKSDPPENESFQERLARLTREAQAATFAKAPDSTVEGGEDPEQPADDTVTVGAAEVSVAADGWTCPEGHGYIDAISPRGRKYRKCSKFDSKECSEFEKV